MQLLKYGLKDGKLVHINDVANGLSCGCVCPSCGGKLEAHQGGNNQYHFKHYSAADCEHGSESALHIMAKNIIADTKTVYVPNAPLNIYDLKPKGKCYKFDNAYIEKAISPNIRCDVLLESGNITLNVEIKVTHEVDPSKKLRLYNENLRTIEIDLSGLIENFDATRIRTVIETGINTELIYSPKAKEIYAKWWLGEWKEIFKDRVGQPYVKKCRYSDGKKITYFTSMGQAYREDHTDAECFYCNKGNFIPYDNYENGLLCCELYGDINFKLIDEIIEIKRKNDIVQYAALIVNGELKTYGKKQ